MVIAIAIVIGHLPRFCHYLIRSSAIVTNHNRSRKSSPLTFHVVVVVDVAVAVAVAVDAAIVN